MNDLFRGSFAPTELKGYDGLQQGLRFALPPAYDLSRLWRYPYRL